MTLDATRIKKNFLFTVLKSRRGEEVVEAGLAAAGVRSRERAQDKDLVHFEVELAYAGDKPQEVHPGQFTLEDSEGYLVEGLACADALRATVRAGGQASGGLLFSIYRDLEPRRLWFDSGQRYADTGDPLLLDVPLAADAPPAEPSWREAAASDYGRQVQAAQASGHVAPLTQTEALLAGLSRTLHLPYKKLANGYMFRVPLPGGRRQCVLMSFSGKDEEGSDLIKFLTLCAPADDGGANHEHFLRTNPSLSYGSIGLARIGDHDYYVITHTQLAETADPEELIKSVTYLARRGDELEDSLTGGEDIH